MNKWMPPLSDKSNPIWTIFPNFFLKFQQSLRTTTLHKTAFFWLVLSKLSKIARKTVQKGVIFRDRDYSFVNTLYFKLTIWLLKSFHSNIIRRIRFPSLLVCKILPPLRIWNNWNSKLRVKILWLWYNFDSKLRINFPSFSL